VPFLISPLLSVEDLSRVKFLHVTRRQLGPGHVSGFDVIGFDWVSQLQMHFNTVEGYELHYDHGLTYLQYKGANGTFVREMVCTDNITCSSFYVNGIDIAAKRAEMLSLLDDLANSAGHNSSSSARALHENTKHVNAHAVRLAEARSTLGLTSITDLSKFHADPNYATSRARQLQACPPAYIRSYGRQLQEDRERNRKLARALQSMAYCCPEGGQPRSCEYGFYCAPLDGSCGSCYEAPFDSNGQSYCDCTCSAYEQVEGVC